VRHRFRWRSGLSGWRRLRTPSRTPPRSQHRAVRRHRVALAHGNIERSAKHSGALSGRQLRCGWRRRVALLLGFKRGGDDPSSHHRKGVAQLFRLDPKLHAHVLLVQPASKYGNNSFTHALLLLLHCNAAVKLAARLILALLHPLARRHG
jgi:hypothetical protein